jgi:glycosyltransferase involved in cell wall biosynthesis
MNTDKHRSSNSGQKKIIWIVNPFDQLPNETDVPRRYWPIARILAEQGHCVIWWSSDFSHLNKTKRTACPDTDGFSIRLIPTDPYSNNTSFARLRNHRQFAKRFNIEAMHAIRSGELAPPNRIVVSLPPLGIAESAFKIREFINSPSLISHQVFQTNPACEVIVDIKDAWPETFYRTLPKPLRKILGPLLLAPMHRSAKHAYRGADRISAVGQSYLDLAQRYLGHKRSASGHQPLQTKAAKPMHLCYHGTDLERFTQKSEDRSQKPEPTHSSESKPLKAVYLGAMGSGYDLDTIIKVAARWKTEGSFPFQIHFAGDGPQLEALKANSDTAGLLIPSTLHSPLSAPSYARVVFHGYLSKSDVEALLLSSHLALVPNRPDSLVACPAKICELAASGLPMLSCLGGEFGTLLRDWHAGSEYKEGGADSLQAAFEKYSNDLDLLNKQSLHAYRMAEALFDRTRSYSELAGFIVDSTP